jgi:hypothetical protein
MKEAAQIAAQITMIVNNPSSTPRIPVSSIAYLALCDGVLTKACDRKRLVNFGQEIADFCRLSCVDAHQIVQPLPP